MLPAHLWPFFSAKKGGPGRMSQGAPDDLAIYLGLQGYEVESIEFLTSDDSPSGDPMKLVHVRNRSGRHVCSECGKSFTDSLFDEHERRRFRDCAIGDFETYIELRLCRVACCGGTRVERFPLAMPGFRMTRRFFERLAARCTRLPVQSVAAMAHLSCATVARLDGRAIGRGLGARAMDPTKLRWVGVAEVS